MKVRVLRRNSGRNERGESHGIVFVQLVALLQKSARLRVHLALKVATWVTMEFKAVRRGWDMLRRMIDIIAVCLRYLLLLLFLLLLLPRLVARLCRHLTVTSVCSIRNGVYCLLLVYHVYGEVEMAGAVIVNHGGGGQIRLRGCTGERHICSVVKGLGYIRMIRLIERRKCSQVNVAHVKEIVKVNVVHVHGIQLPRLGPLRGRVLTIHVPGRLEVVRIRRGWQDCSTREKGAVSMRACRGGG